MLSLEINRVRAINQALVKEGFVKAKNMGASSTNTSQTLAYYWLQSPAKLKAKLTEEQKVYDTKLLQKERKHDKSRLQLIEQKNLRIDMHALTLKQSACEI